MNSQWSVGTGGSRSTPPDTASATPVMALPMCITFKPMWLTRPTRGGAS
ncbi:hypothetical protein [Pandoraea sp. NPDC090278]